jgi:hypothetical protein
MNVALDDLLLGQRGSVGAHIVLNERTSETIVGRIVLAR